MVVTWMLYCIAVSALFGLATLALERALRPYGRPTRWAWAVAMALSAAVPVAYGRVLDLRSRLFPPAPPHGTAAPDVGPLIPAEPQLMELTPALMADLLLLPAWIVASPLLLLAAGGLLVGLRRQRRKWRRETVAGIPVLVSPRTGPAVVGFLRAEIVLPEWVLAWDEPRRRMVVEHEREHVRARDPLLLLLALLSVLLVPWNAALWWQLRRLRLAMEVDCDARVLRGGPDPREYGKLLVDVGGLASTGRIPVPALTEPRSFLERRIRIIASPKTGRRLRAALGYAAVCAAALASAAAVPPVAGIVLVDFSVMSAGAPLPEPQDEVLELSQVTTRPRLANAGRVAAAVREKYPPLLRAAGITGSARVVLVVDRDGAVAQPRVVSATHPAFAEAALEVVREASFIPARRGERFVPVRLQLPVTFTLRGEAGIVDPAVRVGVGLGTASEMSELDTRPRLLNPGEVEEALRAVYPPLLRGAGITGSATVAFVITPRGTVGEAEVVEASRPEFGAAARQAIQGARFSPGVRGGRAVPVRVSLPVFFSLDAPPAAGRPGR